jgi:hypothetical protein
VAALQDALAAEQAARIAADDALSADFDAVEANSVLALDGKLTYDDTTMTALFSEVNVQVVNGAGQTDSINGLGNLIVGYDAARELDNDKSGLHNVVVGDKHRYSRFGGIVGGLQNSITGDWSSVSGSLLGNASGASSSVRGV